jgi:hypothetical protein
MGFSGAVELRDTLAEDENILLSDPVLLLIISVVELELETCVVPNCLPICNMGESLID